MKRILIGLSALLFVLLMLCACGETDSNGFPTMYKIPSNCHNADEVDWDTLLPKIPDDHYIEYPGVHTVPVTATLHKDGIETALDPYDPRLVRLINFYNNALYHYNFYQTFGGLPPDQYQYMLDNVTFRVELTYVPRSGDNSPETDFDKLIFFPDQVLGERTDRAFANYPIWVFGRNPFQLNKGDLLSAFGF